MKGKSALIKKIVAVVSILLVAIGTIITTQIMKGISDLDVETRRAMTYGQVTPEDEQTQSPNVTFSAFFAKDLNNDGIAEKIKGVTRPIGVDGQIGDEGTLYASINVSRDGYLENGVITFVNNNIKWNTEMLEDSIIAGNYKGAVSTVRLQPKVYAGSSKLLAGEISSVLGSNINDYSKVNYVKLTGTYVDGDGNRTQINVERPVTVDWYSYVSTRVNTNNKHLDVTVTDEMILDFTVENQETAKTLLLKDNILKITAPELNGYKAKDARINGDDFEFDPETGVLTVSRSSTINGEGRIVSSLPRTNSYSVTFVYPKEAHGDEGQDEQSVDLFTQIEVPVEAQYTAYNNQNSEFENIVSSTQRTILTLVEERGTVAYDQDSLNVSIGQQSGTRWIVSKEKALNAYNGIYSDDDRFDVSWYLNRANPNTNGNISLRETKKDEMLFIDGTRKINEEYIDCEGVWFEVKNGTVTYINIYDADTNELLKTFYGSNGIHISSPEYNISTYNNENNAYKFEEPVKHIRAEIQGSTYKSEIKIHQIKKLDGRYVAENIDRSEFDDMAGIYTYLTSTGDGIDRDYNFSGYALYREVESKATMSLSPSGANTNTTNIPATITISTVEDGFNQRKWKNGVFLVEFAPDVIYAQVNDVIADNPGVNVIAYDLYKENNKYFLKIYTSNVEDTLYNIRVSTNIYVNPMAISNLETFKLYAYNEDCNSYVISEKDTYDINSNGNTTEEIGTYNTYFNLIAPETFITSQSASNYNVDENVSIAPNVADIDKDARSVDINVELFNNHKMVVSNVKVLGVIPFEGNTYAEGEGNLGSQFTTTMTNEGIKIPSELQGKVTVYYTENGNADENLEKAENGWTTTPDDFSKVKRYLIDFNTTAIPSGRSYSFGYTVNIPEGISYNKTTYSEHAVYYSLNTTEGLLDDVLQPSKLGIKVARKYDFDVSKLNAENNKIVPGAVYQLTQYDDAENVIDTKIVVSNSNGRLIAKGLYIDSIYTLQEVRNPDNYMLNPEVIKFKVTENEEDKNILEITMLSDNGFAITPQIVMENGVETLVSQIKENPRYKIDITKIDRATHEIVEGAQFKLLPDNTTYITNNEGKFSLSALDQNKEYTLKEIFADGYYLMDDITFKLVKENEHFKIESDNEIFANATVDVVDDEDLISVALNLPNERQPQLLINKTDKETHEPIKGVQFKVKDRIGKIYVTDEEGKTLISGFAENEDYTLQEVKADGYYLRDIDFKIVKDETTGKLKVVSEDEEFAAATLIDEDRKILSVNMTNEAIPTFDINLLKLSEGTDDVRLKDAKFNLIDTDTGKITEYTTDENGIINISGLYAYKEGKEGVSGKYTLQEILAPEGYANNAELIKFQVTRDEDNDSYIVEIENESSLKTVKKAEMNGKVLNLIIEDKPMFKLVKVDSETREPLANVEFIIMEIEPELGFAKDINGNYIGTYDEENDRYVVKTNEKGEIVLPLKDGKYYALEVRALEGYESNNALQFFEINTGKAAEPVVPGPVEPETDEPVEKTKVVEINYIEDLVAISNDVNNEVNTYEDTKFKLMRTLDFNDADSYQDATSIEYGDLNGNGTVDDIKTELTQTTGKGFGRIGYRIYSDGYSGQLIQKPFKGDFDGQGNEIRNLLVNQASGKSEANGLFGHTQNSKIENLGVTGKVIGGNLFNQCGGIVGYAENTTINNCYSKVQLSDSATNTTNTRTAGGIVGTTKNCKISNCYNAGIISGTGFCYAGGIVGYGEYYGYTEINDCYNISSITASHPNTSISVGGIIGYGGTAINRCYNTATISVNGKSGYAGGITGGSGTINKCYNIGAIYGKGYAGGISAKDGIISNSYNRGNVTNNKQSDNTGYYKAAGIVGDSGTVINCYNTGNVIGPRYTSQAKGSQVAPINNYNYNNNYVINSYYLSTATLTGITVNRYGIAKDATTLKGEEQPNKLNRYVFKQDTENVNAGYPIFKDDAEIEKVTSVEKIEDLVEISEQVRAAVNYEGIEVKLANTLDFNEDSSYRDPSDTSYGDLNNDGEVNGIKEELTKTEGKGFTPIGINSYLPFKGTFDGQANEIRNIYINAEGNAGLFGYIDGGIVKNLGITGNVIGTGSTGSIAGYLRSKEDLVKCYNKANVKSTSGIAGGIIGEFTTHDGYSAIILKNILVCYNTGNIEGNNETGGIVGKLNNSGIYNCYNVGNVKSNTTEKAGAIAGVTSINASKCYYSNDITVEPEMSNEFGTAKDADYMKTDAFVNEISNRYFVKDTGNVNGGFPVINAEELPLIETYSIEKIEDLVEVSRLCDLGELSKEVEITLENTLDFNEDSSYRDPSDTSYGDLNGDGEVNGIKEELTKVEGKGFAPIGKNKSKPFSGSFDGQGNEIRNIHINNNEACLGLFGVTENAEIKNLGITGKINFNSDQQYDICVGGIVGLAEKTIILNCYNKAEVSSTNFTGGIVGDCNNTKISDCYNEGNISGNNAGGILGYSAKELEIENCYNKGKISYNGTNNYSSGYIGGIGGYIYNFKSAEIKNLYNEGEVTSVGHTGGLFGYAVNDNVSVEFINCYNTGNISSKSNYAGGLCGYSYCYNLKLKDCYNIGNVVGYSHAGGLIGYSGSISISNSYNKGRVENINDGSSYGYAGGFVAYCGAISVNNSYNIGNIVGRQYVAGIAGHVGGNINAENSHNEGEVSVISSSRGYAGGLFGDVYESIMNINNCYNKGDITVKGTGYSYAGGIYASGTAHNYNLIQNCYNEGNILCTNAQYIGGIGGYYGSSIKNCYNTGDIRNVVTSSGFQYIGGIIGHYATVTDCYNTGKISAYSTNTTYVGGISGYNSYGATNTYNTGDIDIVGGYVQAGGIASDGTVRNSYNTGNITVNEELISSTSKYVGGIVGSTSGYAYDSYNTGNIYVESGYNYPYVGGISSYNATNCCNSGNIEVVVKNSESAYPYIGGVSGNGTAKNSYNKGNVKVQTGATSGTAYVGKISGNGYSNEGNYYLNTVELDLDIGELTNAGTTTGQIEISDESELVRYMTDSESGEQVIDEENSLIFHDIKSEGFYNKLNTNGVWTRIEGYEPKLFISSADPIDSVKMELINKMKRYNITTKVETVDAVAGGTITGEGDDPYESVKYGEANKKAISMEPDTGYGIEKITVNGEIIPFEAEEDGTFTMPANYFTNVQEDKEVVVKYSLKKQIVTITKIDKDSNKPLKDAKFNLESVIGSDKIFGKLTNNGDKYFEDRGGTYMPNNTTYTDPIAHSYIPINLTGLEGNYYVTVNHEGYSNMVENISTNTTPNANLSYYTNDNFGFTNGGSPQPTTYTSEVLQGGNQYYLKLASSAWGPGAPYENKVNSITLYKQIDDVTSECLGELTQNSNGTPLKTFEKVDGKIQYSIDATEATTSTMANAYMEIDLSDKLGTYNVLLDIDTEFNGTTFKADVKDSTSAMTDLSPYNQFVYLTSTTNGKTYLSKPLQGGSKYYLQLAISANKEKSAKININDVKVLKSAIEEVFTNTSGNGDSIIEDNQVFGKITSNGTAATEYGFRQSGDKYITYGSNLFTSYVEVDLTGEDKVGKNYNVLVNLEKTLGGTLGVNISNTTNKITDQSPYNKFIYLTAPTGASTYSSPVLQGGNKYYLQLAAFSGGGVTINSIDLVENEVVDTFDNNGNGILSSVNKKEADEYYFEYSDGKLIPNNMGSSLPNANSYVEIDLTGKTGKYAVELKAQTNSPQMVAKITENLEDTCNISDYTSDKNFMWVNGGSPSNGVTSDYSYVSKVLEGGKKYYLLLASTSRTNGYIASIDSVKLLKYKQEERFQNNKGDRFAIEGLVTDENGQIKVTVPHIGRYLLTETEAPEGYLLLDSPVAFDVKDKEDNQVTIRNRSKIPVTVHHYLKDANGTKTTTRVAEDEVNKYFPGDTYATTPKLNLDKLDLERGEDNEYVIPENSSGEIGNEPIVVNYYYEAIPLELTIHHYLDGTDQKIAEDETKTYQPQIGIEDGFVTGINTNQTYNVKENANYTRLLTQNYLSTLITQDDDIVRGDNITFNKDSELIYYYKVAKGQVTVQYLEKDTERELLDPETTEDTIGRTYVVEQKEIEGYTFVERDGDLLGKYEVEPKVVKLYYKKNTKVTVNHIDNSLSSELPLEDRLLNTKTYDGLVGDQFTSTSMNFRGYVLVRRPENETVIMTEDEIVLNYYYDKINSGVIEKHIDIKTNEILANETHDGYVGDHYKIDPRTFIGYDLVEERLPINAEGEMSNIPIEVIYYYIRITSVEVHYTDKLTGEELADTVSILGHEGDRYTTENKTFEGYELIAVPENAQGTMRVEKTLDDNGNPVVNTKTIVNYEYREISAGVLERHIDDNTNVTMEEETHRGYVGDEYSIPSRIFEGYDLVERKLPTNAEGTMTKELITVDYYYTRRTKVEIRYADKETGEDISSKDVIDGHVGDEYATTAKDISGYELVVEELPTNAEGTMTKDTITVIYKYISKKAKVIERHVDINTNELIEQETVHNGLIGDEYLIRSKEFDKYELVEGDKLPTNAQGTMTEEDIIVTYYYTKKRAKVEVSYLEKETNKKLAKTEIIEGYDGDNYETVQKDIPFYKFVEIVGNKTGVMEVKVIRDGDQEIVNDTIKVIYYYEAVPFDIKVDKTITKVILNGEEQKITNGKLTKAEIHRKKLDTTTLTVEYTIKVSNIGELAGGATLKETIPDGFIMDPQDNKDWTIEDGIAQLKIDELKPGEEKEYKVILQWKKGELNIGTKVNIAGITEIINDPGFEDKDKDNNESSATLILTVSTGREAENNILIAATGIVIILSAGIFVKVSKKED